MHTETTCAVEGCGGMLYIRGYCTRCYSRLRYQGKLPTLHPKGLPISARLTRFITRGEPDSCWEWTGGKDADGYGHIAIAGRTRRAHAVAWEVAHGQPIPIGKVVMHVVCDNPPCCNVAHLDVGTNNDNVADKVAKGRQARGENHYATSLTDADVREIRRRYVTGDELQREIAHDFGVSVLTVSRIVRRKTWMHVE